MPDRTQREAEFVEASAQLQERLTAVFLQEPLERMPLILHALAEVFCKTAAYLDLADGHRGIGVQMLGKATDRLAAFTREHANRHLIAVDSTEPTH